MASISPIAVERFGYDFIPQENIPPGKDEYWLRNLQIQADSNKVWRNLEPRELEILIKNGNSCSRWDMLLVSDPFDPSLIRNSYFYGLVRIGSLRNVMLQHNDFYVSAGIRNSTIISCDIGNDVAIQDCPYISHYIIGDCCILSRIDEMQTTNHAKFGNGSIKDGEEEDVRAWIEVMNEAGGRAILPFQGMLSADAYLWASYRDDTGLTEALKNITQKEYGGYRGSYGTVGANSTIKSCHIIKDVSVGEWAYIKGANKLKNITVLSSKEEPSQIGEGAEMVNGIMGYGCSAFYGIKAVRFVMGRCSNLKYGARLIHSVLGDNSTISCCEILNNLIFPIHEQHHNNSFLIACLIQGMSNVAAGATVGSNHNSRSNDGEIVAHRGFWPGLSVTLKHCCRFASFIFLSKGDYPFELNIKFPFALVSINSSHSRLEVMPAYFWMHNLFALERNSWKSQARDKRKVKEQHIETDYLAPDTVEEIIAALSQMETLFKSAGVSAEELLNVSNASPGVKIEDEPVAIKGMERNNRPEVLLKPRHAWAAYRQMLLYYVLKTLADYLEKKPELSYEAFVNEIEAGGKKERVSEWVNLGGQIVPSFKVDKLREQIRLGKTDTWNSIHASYDEMFAAYPLDRVRHAWEVYRYLEGETSSGTAEHPLKKRESFIKEMDNLILINRHIAEHVFLTRAKDYNDPYRAITYRNKEEMKQVVGTAEDNSFVKNIRERTKRAEEGIAKLSARLKA